MTTVVLADNAYATLSVGIATTDSSITLSSGQGARFPAIASPSVMYACILNTNNILEEIQITTHTAGSDLLGIVRAAGSTTAKAWSAGDRVEARLSSTVIAGLPQPETTVFKYMTAAQIADVQALTALVDVTTPINNYISATAVGGNCYFPPGKYLVTGITVAKKVNFIGLGCAAGGIPEGAYLYSTTDAAILTFNTATQSMWQTVENLGILGSGSGSSQHGVVVNNAGIYMRNFVIRAAGGDGLRVTNCYRGTFQNGYISACGSDGVEINGTVGANVWSNVESGGNTGNGFHFASMDGSDVFYGCQAENNGAYGAHLKTGVKGCRADHWFSEGNSTGTILFDSGSEENKWHFNSFSSSAPESAPLSSGTRNSWSGRPYNQEIIEPKLIQRVYTEYFAVSTGAPNAIPYDDTPPQSNEGLSIMSRVISPKAAGNKLKVQAWGMVAASAGNQITTSLFINASTDATYATGHFMSANNPVPFSFEYEYTVSSTAAITFTVNAGSESSATVTFNGSSGSRKYGGIAVSGISIEEFMP